MVCSDKDKVEFAVLLASIYFYLLDEAKKQLIKLCVWTVKKPKALPEERFW